MAARKCDWFIFALCACKIASPLAFQCHCCLRNKEIQCHVAKKTVINVLFVIVAFMKAVTSRWSRISNLQEKASLVNLHKSEPIDLMSKTNLLWMVAMTRDTNKILISHFPYGEVEERVNEGRKSGINTTQGKIEDETSKWPTNIQ